MSLSVTSRFLAQTANTFVYWPHTKYVITMWPQSHVKNSSESVGMCRAQIQIQPLLWQLKKLGQTQLHLTAVVEFMKKWFNLYQRTIFTDRRVVFTKEKPNNTRQKGLFNDCLFIDRWTNINKEISANVIVSTLLSNFSLYFSRLPRPTRHHQFPTVAGTAWKWTGFGEGASYLPQQVGPLTNTWNFLV